MKADQTNNVFHRSLINGDGMIGSDGLASLDASANIIPAFAGITATPTLGFNVDAASGTLVSQAGTAASSPGLGGSSGTVQTQAGSAGGFVILADYDTSITNLGTASSQYIAIDNAISAAIGYYESVISTNVTIAIGFGYGEVNGISLGSSALGESVSNITSVSYRTLSTDLTTIHGDSTLAVPTSSPAGRTARWEVTYAEGQALGISPSTPIVLNGTVQDAGWVGISSSQPFTFDPANRAVAGEYDVIGTFEHEISEVLGRISSLGTYAGTGVYMPLDLFRYDPTTGTRALSPGTGSFSTDGGATFLAAFNNPVTQSGDSGDWASSVTADSYDAFSGQGTANIVSATDLTVLRQLGYSTVACYVAGTRILGLNGEIRVEDLVPGDLVRTRFAGVAPVKWIGHRHMDCRRHADPARVRPIRVAAGAFGPEQPRHDVLLSPDHAVAVNDVLIPIKLLVNGASIRPEVEAGEVHYFHVELDRHDILFADGLAAESYLDTGNRGMFENADSPLILHPILDATDARGAASCLPFHREGARVYPVWQTLAERAARLGIEPRRDDTTDDPAPRIIVNGRAIDPVARTGDHYTFVLPAAPAGFRLRSRHASPSTTHPWLDDPRRLGVAVRRITFRQGETRLDLALDDPRLTMGWWPVERNDISLWRWTDGDAVFPPVDGPVIVEILLNGHQGYPLEARPAMIQATRAA